MGLSDMAKSIFGKKDRQNSGSTNVKNDFGITFKTVVSAECSPSQGSLISEFPVSSDFGASCLLTDNGEKILRLKKDVPIFDAQGQMQESSHLLFLYQGANGYINGSYIYGGYSAACTGLTGAPAAVRALIGDYLLSDNSGVIKNKPGEIFSADINGFRIRFKVNSNADAAQIDEYNDTNAERLVIPARLRGLPVTAVGKCAFYGNRTLTEIVLPEGIEKIGSNAFTHNTRLKTVHLPDSLQAIGDSAFSDCESLESLDLPKGLEKISESAFGNCPSLKCVFITAGLKSISSDTFAGCKSLTFINVHEDNPAYTSKDGVLYSKDGSRLIMYPAGRADESFTVPESVVSIEAKAFDGCKNLKSIFVSKNVKHICSRAFSGCEGLCEITLPNTMEIIDDNSFADCSALKEITLPKGLITICDNAFNGCAALERIAIPDSVERIGDGAFGGCALLKEIRLPSSLNKLGDNVFSCCGSLQAIYICQDNLFFKSQDGVLFDKMGAKLIRFPEAADKTEYSVPQGTREIDRGAFRDCLRLTAIYIPVGVMHIGDNAFDGCRHISYINLPDGLATIGISAFSRCSDMTEIALPCSTNRVSKCAFSHCSSLDKINFRGSIDQWRSINFDPDAFLHCKKPVTIMRP